MIRTTLIIALAGVLLGGLVIGGASGYLDYIERQAGVFGIAQGTCANLNAFVDEDLDSAIDERAADRVGDDWWEYLRRQGREDEIPESERPPDRPEWWDPDGVRAERDFRRAEEERALAADYFRPAVDAAARCTRAASIVGIRNGVDGLDRNGDGIPCETLP